MNKLSGENKLKRRGIAAVEYFKVPDELREKGFKYAWARKTQADGTDAVPLPPGWKVVLNKGEAGPDGKSEGSYKGLDRMIRRGDTVLMRITDEEYNRNLSDKVERTRRLMEGSRMKSQRGRDVRVDSEFRQETEIVG